MTEYKSACRTVVRGRLVPPVRFTGSWLFANLLGVNGRVGMLASVHDHTWLVTLKFDLNSLHEKFNAVFRKHSRNSGER
jgi:hypothetical protein